MWKQRDVGITEILCKPLSANDLFRRIQNVIENPRPFVSSTDFIGPDRRRNKHPYYQGECRRQFDQLPREARGYVRGALTGIANIEALFDFLDTVDFPGPNKEIKNSRLRFYFTERGWREVGKKVTAELKRLKIPHRVLRIKNNTLDVQYRDWCQVAGLIRKSRRRTRRKRGE